MESDDALCEHPRVRITGHGIDVIDVIAVERLRSRPYFDERCFTELERDESGGSSSFLAGRFAAKEAVLKALGTGLVNGLSWRDIEIRRLASGEPVVVLSGGVERLATTKGVVEIFISISHSGTVAMASAIAVVAG